MDEPTRFPPGERTEIARPEFPLFSIPVQGFFAPSRLCVKVVPFFGCFQYDQGNHTFRGIRPKATSPPDFSTA
jgi:hypothetical protein